MAKMNSYQKLKAEKQELELKCEKLESEKQELKVENATQKQLIESKNETIDVLKQLKESKDEITKAKDQAIEILMKCSATEERFRDEESKFSKSCLNLQ
ncbi:hypothetical protein ACQKBC_06570 [Helicobacter pylori]|uniref:hypothetical protein n=1 Tax=Helicobacter pylori TaxID=210 RepID=UPI0002B9637D|nr:hypothetical protein [Helicobacter pylori]EMH25471.1 hypothetical protein HMPREF1419_00517 [Helicobacter pylori GAM263BFi]